MLKSIFYNTPKADCSIHETGIMCYNALKLSNKYQLDYTENSTRIDGGYDFCIFNHHHATNYWMVDNINQFSELTFAIVTEVGDYQNVLPYTPQIFDNYIILDPTIVDNNIYFGFSRPLESTPIRKKENNKLIIGSFGFPTPGKNWNELIERTQIEFDEALIRFHIPRATHVPNSDRSIERIMKHCQSQIFKPDIKLEFSHHYMDKNALIDWCTQNTINVFLYDRNQPGLSATTDQAIVSERPLWVSKNPTFRHVLFYMNPYPQTITEAINTTLPMVKQMKKDWSPKEFAMKFETILQEKYHELH
jgi:hypothetical protein